jgi:hypothetical protein
MRIRWILIVAVAHFLITAVTELVPWFIDSSVDFQKLERRLRIWDSANAILTFPVGLLEYGGLPFLPMVVNSLLWGAFIVWGGARVLCRSGTISPKEAFQSHSVPESIRFGFLLQLLLIALFCFVIWPIAAAGSLTVFAFLLICTFLNRLMARKVAHFAGWNVVRMAWLFHLLGLFCMLIIVLLMIVPYPSAKPIQAGAQQELSFSETVIRMKSLNDHQGIPRHLMMLGAFRWRTDFDVNLYFTVLTRLRPEPGYVLDYVYDHNRLGGSPVLYARRRISPPFLTCSAYVNAIGQDTVDTERDYLNHVQIDDSPRGYLQFVLLSIMANQFYLYWHANYNDEQIVHDRKHFDDLLSKQDVFNKPTPEEQERSRSLSPDPIVELDQEAARVSLLTWTEWGGLYRKTFTIKRQFPHQILDTKEENVLSYWCGVTF